MPLFTRTSSWETGGFIFRAQRNNTISTGECAAKLEGCSAFTGGLIIEKLRDMSGNGENFQDMVKCARYFREENKYN